MDDQPTCGKGLAAHATLPATLGRVMAATAGILENHQKALVLDDPNARLEYDAYVKLARAYRDIAEKLQMTADQMTGYRQLPMANKRVTSFQAFHRRRCIVSEVVQEAGSAYSERIVLLQLLHAQRVP